MPTYEFRCPDGHEFEKFYRSISGAESQAACPFCGQPAERMMSAAGFAFKGSGFYLTDYGKNAHRTQGDAQKPGGGSESKGENASGTPESGGAKSPDASPAGSKAPDSKSSESKSSESKSSDSKSSESKSKSSESKVSEAKPSGSKPSSSGESKASGSGPAAP